MVLISFQVLLSISMGIERDKMKGLQILLNSLGIKIEPSQIEDAFQRGKDALPRIAASFDELNTRMNRMEIILSNVNDKLSFLMAQNGEVKPNPVHENILSSVSSQDLTQAFIVGSSALVTRDV